MVTGYEVEMYQNIGGIRRALERIAVALEALAEAHGPIREEDDMS